MNTILGLGFILMAGIASARFINKLKFPAVTAYLILGILIGPSFLNLISPGIISATGLISNIVLGVIAFSIGQNFSIANFRNLGKPILWISIFEACGAWILVTFSFIFILKQPFYLSILFGAIASATAPAATIMIIREYRARGIFTDTLLGVVAIDDAWCLIIFALSLALAKAVSTNITDTFLLIKVILRALLEIGGACLLGSLLAIIFAQLSKFIRSSNELLIYTLGFILLDVGIALTFQLSVLLSAMFFGAVLVNAHLASFKFFDSIQSIDSPLFLLFFVLAGANLEISMLKTMGALGCLYIFFRTAGKIMGANIGARISGASDTIRKYLGWGLLPEGGVELGCALVAKSYFPGPVGSMFFSTIVATTVVFELIGPVCSKYALQKAGEIMIKP